MRAVRQTSRDWLATIVGVGRGAWLFPLDVDVPDLRPPLRLDEGRVRPYATVDPCRDRPAARRTSCLAGHPQGARLRAIPFGGRSGGWGPAASRHPSAAARNGQADLRRPLRPGRAVHRRSIHVRRYDDRRIERLDRHAVQLDPRAPRARGRPSQHRLLRPLRLRDRAARDDQRVLDGRLGGRLQHEPRDDAPRDREVDRTRSRQDPVDAGLSRADLPVPDLGLSALPQAPARRGRPPRLPVGGVPDPRARRRRGHDRGAARLPARAIRVRLFGLRRDRHRDRDGRRVAGQHRRPPPRPGPARRPAWPCSGRTRGCRWSSSTTR